MRGGFLWLGKSSKYDLKKGKTLMFSWGRNLIQSHMPLSLFLPPPQNYYYNQQAYPTAASEKQSVRSTPKVRLAVPNSPIGRLSRDGGRHSLQGTPCSLKARSLHPFGGRLVPCEQSGKGVGISTPPSHPLSEQLQSNREIQEARASQRGARFRQRQLLFSRLTLSGE